jgi:cytochrome P450
MARLVGPQVLQRLRGDVEVAAETLVEQLLARQRFDAATDLVSPFTVAVIADAVGLPREGREQLPVFGQLALASSGPRNASFDAALAPVQSSGTMQWVQQMCERESLAPGGLGAQLYLAADAGEITAARAQRLVRVFHTAAVDTTITTLINGLMNFIENPEQWVLLRQDRSRARGRV